MKIALLGYAQAGKKTLFELLTGRPVPAGRKPGESVEGIAPIRDERVDELSRICRPKRTVYAENHFVLCPDLTEGAAERDWLDAARRCDAVCLVVRAFASDEVYHPQGTVDPARDLEGLQSELLLADMVLAERRLHRIAKDKNTGRPPGRPEEEAVLRRGMEALEAGRPLRELELDPHEYEAVKSLELVSFLPTLAVHNVGEDQAAMAAEPGAINVCALLEQEIMAIEDHQERSEYLASYGLTSSGLDRVNAAAYAAMGLMSFYTVGPDEARAWTIRTGSAAPVAGGKIHSDIERGFIRVETMTYSDFVELGSEKAVRDAGKMHTRGRDYVIQDGDICHFLFNV
jgi:GTP-binding protein YchF